MCFFLHVGVKQTKRLDLFGDFGFDKNIIPERRSRFAEESSLGGRSVLLCRSVQSRPRTLDVFRWDQRLVKVCGGPINENAAGQECGFWADVSAGGKEKP